MTLGGRTASAVVRAYQLAVRPLLPSVCRFEPSCSEYCRQVFEAHGLMRGAALGLRRIGRCHPWNAGGYDPPPERKGIPGGT